MKNKFFIKIGILMLFMVLIFSSGVFAGGGGDSGDKKIFNSVCNTKNCHYTSAYKKNRGDFDVEYSRYIEGWKKITYNNYKSFTMNKNFDLYFNYLLIKTSQGDARIYIQKYDGGWKTMFYKRHFKGSTNNGRHGGFSSLSNLYFANAVFRNLSPGKYRIRARVYGKDGGAFHDNDRAKVGYSYGIVKSSPPTINTSILNYRENQYKTNLIGVSGSGGLKCSGNLLSGMKISAASNGCKLSWKPPYSINKNTSSGRVRKTIKVYAERGGVKVSKNVSVYVENKPYPITNINNNSYKRISDLSTPKISFSLPTVPQFDSSDILDSQVNLTDLTKYIFKEVEETPPHPGDKPLMLTAKESSLVNGTKEEIDISLTTGDIKGYNTFKEELVEFNKARNAYESLEEFLNTQYDEKEIENKKPFNKGLENVIEYNKNKNNLGKPLDIENYKDYSNMEEVYKALKEQLEERQNKMNYNIEQHNKYKEKVESYNSDLEPEINKLVNRFQNSYISEFNLWKNERDSYLYNLDKEITEAINHNNKLYNDKKREIEEAIDNYGMVSLKVSDITKKPSSYQLREHLGTQRSKFDNDNKIPNIYESLKDNESISSATKTAIKDKFNDGVYNTDKLNWLRDTIEEDLRVDIKEPVEYNEKYLLE